MYYRNWKLKGNTLGQYELDIFFQKNNISPTRMYLVEVLFSHRLFLEIFSLQMLFLQKIMLERVNVSHVYLYQLSNIVVMK